MKQQHYILLNIGILLTITIIMQMAIVDFMQYVHASIQAPVLLPFQFIYLHAMVACCNYLP